MSILVAAELSPKLNQTIATEYKLNRLCEQVLALIRTDTPESQLKADVLESLEDFLKDNTSSFVDDIFQALQTNSYKPGYVPPRPAATVAAPAHLPDNAAQSRARAASGAGSGSSTGFPQSKKRSFNEAHENRSGVDSHYAQGERAKRQIRGGSRGGRGGFGGQRNGYPQSASPPLIPGFPNLPQLPPGLGFDPNDPMAAIMAMQAMGLPPLPNMPNFPQAMPANGQSQFGTQNAQSEKTEPCTDYETKGFCLRGDSCPYLHGNDHLVMPGNEGALQTQRLEPKLTWTRI